MISEQTNIFLPLKERLTLLCVYMSTSGKHFLNEIDSWKFLQEYICFIENQYCDVNTDMAIEVKELSQWYRYNGYFYFLTSQTSFKEKFYFIIRKDGAITIIDFPCLCHYVFTGVFKAEFMYNHQNKNGVTFLGNKYALVPNFGRDIVF